MCKYGATLPELHCSLASVYMLIIWPHRVDPGLPREDLFCGIGEVGRGRRRGGRLVAAAGKGFIISLAKYFWRLGSEVTEEDRLEFPPAPRRISLL